MTVQPDLEHDAPPPGVQILWGRVLVLFLALALAFWLGTTFAGDGEADAAIAEQRDEIARLEAQIVAMEAEMAALDAAAARTASPAPRTRGGGADDAATPTPGRQGDTGRASEQAGGDGGDQGADASEAADARSGGGEQQGGERYVIESGDSLASIAQEVYGDPTRWRDIARANDLDEPYGLTVGQTLRIPASP